MSFQITIYNPQTAVSQTLSLEADRIYTVGSSDDSDVVLQHPFVAVAHARLEAQAAFLTLTDLGSANGTAVNGHRIAAHEPISLQPRDVIDIALFQITVAAAVAEAALPSLESTSPTSPTSPAHSLLVPPGGQPPGPPALPPAVTLPDGSHPNYRETAFRLGLPCDHSRYVQYLPALYDTPFTHRFLALFESLLAPIVWRIDGLDLYLDPDTAPAEFLPWLAGWYSLTFDHTWDEARRRQLLRIAPRIFRWWGTRRALCAVLAVYTATEPVIIDDERLPPFTFRVELALPEDEARRQAVERLINTHKPAHTSYELLFTG